MRNKDNETVKTQDTVIFSFFLLASRNTNVFMRAYKNMAHDAKST